MSMLTTRACRLVLRRNFVSHHRGLATTTNTLLPSPTSSSDPSANNNKNQSGSTSTTTTSSNTIAPADKKKKKHIVFGNRGPSLQDFLNSTTGTPTSSHSHSKPLDPTTTTPLDVPYLSMKGRQLGQGSKYFVEVYGCQMNVNDTEILMAIMNGAGYSKADDLEEADIVFLVTCAIRENAETRIWNRLADLKRRRLGPLKDRAPLVGVLGVSFSFTMGFDRS